ncbi:1492_t:CDS:1, partial [Scutellospora calospora]
LRVLKLLLFATIQEQKETEDQIYIELLLLETQLTISNNNDKIKRNSIITNEDPLNVEL